MPGELPRGSDPILCPACGKPEGTGTLLDLRPEPPTTSSGMYLATWQRFAARYLCPACAAYREEMRA